MVSLTALNECLNLFWLVCAERCRKLTVSALEFLDRRLFLVVVEKEKRKLSEILAFIMRIYTSLCCFSVDKIKSTEGSRRK